MTKVALQVEYPLHVSNEIWVHEEDLHCPKCGEKKVWVDNGAGDYYEGPSHLCVGCSCHFSLPRCEVTQDQHDVQRLNQIKERAHA